MQRKNWIRRLEKLDAEINKDIEVEKDVTKKLELEYSRTAIQVAIHYLEGNL